MLLPALNGLSSYSGGCDGGVVLGACCTGSLRLGRGGQTVAAISGGCVGWKRWHNDDGVEVEGWTTETAQPSLLPTSRGTLPLTAGVQQECGPLLRRDTSTTAPNHPHNTDALHSAKRPGAGGRSTPGAWGKHCITQPHSGRTVGGGRRAVEDAPSASWQGGNTPRTPQARGRVLEAEDRIT